MARQQGTYKLASNIEPRAAAPLDAREKVALKNDLTATGTFPYPYEGMEVYVVEEKKKYVLTGDDPTVANNWQEGRTLYADAPIGTISPFGGSVVPSGYLLCNGNEVLKTAYAELYAVIGDAFGTASDNTKFKLPDLREATTKGVGLSGKSSAHLDADGLAVGEFLDDRVQTHTHDIVCEFGAAGLPDYRPGDTYSQVAGVNAGSRVPIQAININSGRHGATTEVKAVGVNYIIKAKQVAVPFDMAEYVRNQNVRLFRLDGYYLPNAVTVGQFAYAAINTGKTLSQLTNGYLGDTAVDKSRCVINLLYSDGGMALLNTYIYDGKLWIEVYNHWSITRQISRIWLEIIAFPAELTTNV